jgi:hypothetical protein
MSILAAWLATGSTCLNAFVVRPLTSSRILKGAKLGDLPVEFPPKLELVINLRAAKEARPHVPPALLTFADDLTPYPFDLIRLAESVALAPYDRSRLSHDATTT